MTTQIRSLMFVAAVAILPVACGTSSPMGTDLAALEAGAQVSSFRSDPSAPVPPQAPEPQSPESDTVPAPTSIELPAGRPALPSNSDPVPSPAPSGGGTGSEPVPSPSGPNSDPVPSPAPSGGGTGSEPVPPPSVPGCGQTGFADPGCTPAPSPVPPTDPAECQVLSIEIMAMRQTIAEPAGEGFMALLTDRDGSLIEDDSCEKLVWAVEGAGTAVVIHYENDSRYVYIEGMQGANKVSVTAPNGVATSIAYEVK